MGKIKKIGYLPNRYGKSTPVYREGKYGERFIYLKRYNKRIRSRSYL